MDRLRTPPATARATRLSTEGDGGLGSSVARSWGGAPRARLRRRCDQCEKERRTETLLSRAEALNRWEANFWALAAANDEDSSTGAMALAVAAALALAATPTPNGHLFALKAARLATWVDTHAEPSRSHVAALLEAALAVDAGRDGREPPPLRGWAMATVASGGIPPRDQGSRDRPAVTAEVRTRCVEAAAPADPDLALMVLAHATRVIAAAPPSERGPALDAVEEMALALCVRPAATARDRTATRPALAMSWLVLRRCRPGAAAILRAQLRLDRARWTMPRE